jgi:hypothetical protein
MVCQMLTEITVIAAGKCMSDGRGDVWQSREMGISFSKECMKSYVKTMRVNSSIEDSE